MTTARGQRLVKNEFVFYLLFSAPFGLRTCSSVQFQMRIRDISGCRFRFPNTQDLVISRCCFAEDGKEMYKDL